MLVKILTLIFIFLNPFVFLIGQPNADFDQTSNITPAELPIPASLHNFDPGLANAMAGFVISASGRSNPDFLPIRDWSVKDPAIEAQAALVFEPEKDKILYQKNIEQVLPIASLTKLMTAIIVLENMNLDQVVTVSQKAIDAYGDMGDLVLNEKISVKNLLYALLMESSNDAAVALAEAFNEGRGFEGDFQGQSCLAKSCFASTAPENPDRSVPEGLSLVSLMNEKAQELGLKNTHFVDPTGYEPANVSTAFDLAKLVQYSLHQPIIWQILKTPTIDLSSADGIINHHLNNTNQLLNHLPNIVGGKTGYTEEAQECMILVTENSQANPLIFIVLGTQARFLETKKLVQWVEKAYIW
jgi:D-alanyl-D-alanine carboxypeptidase